MPVRVVVLLCALMALLPGSAAAAGGSSRTDLIVVREPGVNAAERAQIRRDAGVRHDRDLRVARMEVVSVPADRAGQALRELRADPDVRAALPDLEVHAATNDADWDDLWGMNNLGWYGGLADADMDIPEAWAYSTGSGVTVAVLDTGVDFAHEDLQGQLALEHQWDFVDNDPVAQDEQANGHGTHVTGTVAAIADNGVGVAGVAPDAKVMPLRVLDENGDGQMSDILEAFDWAGDHGAAVVNASLSAVYAGSYYSAFEPVLAAHPDTLFVVAAGNDYLDLGATNGSQQWWSLPCESGADSNLICVGASTTHEQRAAFSNVGDQEVDIFAPGEYILSARNGGGYHWMNGTSMASPMVAGEAALLAAADSDLTGAQLKQLIVSTGDPFAQYAPLSVTGMRANAANALTALLDDADLDGAPSAQDNCPETANPGQEDTDGDGTGDECDQTPRGHDDDADGLPAVDDNCPETANPGQEDTDGDGTGDECDATPRGHDDDADGFPAVDDNCPTDANPGQEDTDADGTGDACDSTPNGDDPDGDGVLIGTDNCPELANAGQEDSDGDGAGDACDATPRGHDDDADEIPALDDNCPDAANPGQEDADADGAGDACDPTPNGDDPDGDGVLIGTDNCPELANPEQTDTDGDATGDACDPTPRGHDDDADELPALDDNCPDVANPEQTDTDGDGTGDACDPTPRGHDDDGDSAPALDDNCPDAANPGQADADQDGSGDVCDSTPRGGDPDGDHVPALDDNCPDRANAGQQDADRDGTGDACDATPHGPDSDRDGLADLLDSCAHSAGPASNHGCPPPVDSDGDGITDPLDQCPAAAGPAGNGGCPPPVDSDGDGITDNLDRCPSAPGPASNHGCELVEPKPPKVTELKPRANRKLVRVTVDTGAAAKVQLTVQRRSCLRTHGKRRCQYKTVKRKTVSVGSRRVHVKLRGRFKAGRYRAVAYTRVNGRSGTRKTVTFKIR